MTDLGDAEVWGYADLEAAGFCPACHVMTHICQYVDLHDRLEGVPGRWSMRKCARCSSLLLDPRPTVQTIGKAYVSYYTHRSGAQAYQDDNGNSVLWRLANGYMNARFGSHRAPSTNLGRFIFPWLFPLRQQLEFFYRHLPRGRGRLMDVGCGNGVFLLRAKAAGWNVVGLEPDPAAAAGIRSCGLDVHCGTLDTFDESNAFDVVTASHVIEHVHDPEAFLAQIFALLRADGTIWLATPNVKSLGHRVFGRAWRGLEPPRHITVYSARALHTLLTAAGFTNIRFRRRGRGSAYILRASKALAAGRKRQLFPLSAGLVDLLASVCAYAGEELVVTARKPLA